MEFDEDNVFGGFSRYDDDSFSEPETNFDDLPLNESETSVDVEPTPNRVSIGDNPSIESGQILPTDSTSTQIEKTCPQCGKHYTRKDNLLRHMRTHDKVFPCDACEANFQTRRKLRTHMKVHRQLFSCNVCKKVFLKENSLTRHLEIHELKNKNPCPYCNKKFRWRYQLIDHVDKYHSEEQKTPVPVNRPRTYERTSSALFGIFATYMINSTEETSQDMLIFFNYIRPQLNIMIKEEMEERRALKWYGTLHVTMVRTGSDGVSEYISPYFRSNVKEQYLSDNIDLHITETFQKISQSFDAYMERGSGWVLERVNSFELSIARYRTLV